MCAICFDSGSARPETSTLLHEPRLDMVMMRHRATGGTARHNYIKGGPAVVIRRPRGRYTTPERALYDAREVVPNGGHPPWQIGGGGQYQPGGPAHGSVDAAFLSRRYGTAPPTKYWICQHIKHTWPYSGQSHDRSPPTMSDRIASSSEHHTLPGGRAD